jgi:hypothetical protein
METTQDAIRKRMYNAEIAEIAESQQVPIFSVVSAISALYVVIV